MWMILDAKHVRTEKACRREPRSRPYPCFPADNIDCNFHHRVQGVLVKAPSLRATPESQNNISTKASPQQNRGRSGINKNHLPRQSFLLSYESVSWTYSAAALLSLISDCGLSLLFLPPPKPFFVTDVTDLLKLCTTPCILGIPEALTASLNRSFGEVSPRLVGSSVNSICRFALDEDEDALVALISRE